MPTAKHRVQVLMHDNLEQEIKSMARSYGLTQSKLCSLLIEDAVRTNGGVLRLWRQS